MATVLGDGPTALQARPVRPCSLPPPTRPPPAGLSAETSTSLVGNLPLALLAVVTVRWAFLKLERQQRACLRAARQEARGWRREGGGGEALPPSPFGVPASAARPEAWRKFVRAPVVEEAWARFCGSIVQEVRCVLGGIRWVGALSCPHCCCSAACFVGPVPVGSPVSSWPLIHAMPLQFIYDMWWASFTPDREFPAEVGAAACSCAGALNAAGTQHLLLDVLLRCALEGSLRIALPNHRPAHHALPQVRRLLNAAFGQLAMRARQADLRAVMNDLCELCMEQVRKPACRWRLICSYFELSAPHYLSHIRCCSLQLVHSQLMQPCLRSPRPSYVQLELYRDSRESILLATQQPNCLCVGWSGDGTRSITWNGCCTWRLQASGRGQKGVQARGGEMRCVTGLHKAATTCAVCRRDMSTAARDRAFKAEMRAEGNLHPALQTPDGHYKVRGSAGSGQFYFASTGWWLSCPCLQPPMPAPSPNPLSPCSSSLAPQFLRAVSEGVVAYLVDVEDVKRPTARVVCRELLAACVFRPLLGWAAPYYFNKALYSFLGAPQVGGLMAEEWRWLWFNAHLCCSSCCACPLPVANRLCGWLMPS